MVDEPVKPVAADIGVDDQEFDPSLEPKNSKAWLNRLQESEDAFEEWNNHCDKINKQYASLSRLAQMGRDKEFSMFWANIEVIRPSIYAKTPVPVVVPKFKDRRPVYQAASEVAERCAVVAFDLARINDLMLLVRDDLALLNRGVAWCRYESGDKGPYGHEKVCIDFKDRRDFLHSVSRNWREVTWVAAASYMTRAEARDRFHDTSGDEYQQAEYTVNRDDKEVGGSDSRERAKFWEIWAKGSKRVVWVAKGCEKILDEDNPHLELQNFFPCPMPAYGAVQRGSLIPVPDVLQYKDQLDEINLLTGRIHALADALEAKGFYPAGGAEIADAVQTAVATHTKGRMLVPIKNWAAFGGTKEVIIWLPIDMIATTITALVTLRKQVIEDIYQIMGLADIMRGATDPKETLGAQQLKTQYGSARIRDKQGEMVRIARDLVEITTEIITEKFKPQTIVAMSQTELPTKAMTEKKIGEVMQQMQAQQMQLRTLMANPQVQQMAQQNPQQAQQIAQQAQKAQEAGIQTVNQLKEKPTIDQVLAFLKDNRTKSFVLDIETDSTIQVDENAEKQRRTEFVGVLGQLLPQLAQMIAGEPSTAAFCGELLKFAVAPFRAGRSMDGTIDELVEQMKQKSGQPQPNPDAEKTKVFKDVEMAKIEQKKATDAAELKIKQQELVQKDRQHQEQMENQRRIAWAQAQIKLSDTEGKAQIQQEKVMENREAHQAHMIEKSQDLQLNAQKAQMASVAQQHKINDQEAKASERRAMQQFKMTQPQAPRRQ